MAQDIWHCNNCGKDIHPKLWLNQGNMLLLSTVLFFFLFPVWIIFILMNIRKKICPHCKSSNIRFLTEEEAVKYRHLIKKSKN